jgi:hypothetical protein
MELLLVFLRMHHYPSGKGMVWLLPIVFIGVVIAEYLSERKKKMKSINKKTVPETPGRL